MLHTESTQAIQAIQKQAGNLEPGAKLVFVSGNFNIIHPGHLRLLQFAAECGDYLVVGVYQHKDHDTPVPEALRLAGVQSINVVNHAFILKDSTVDFIKALKPAIVVKGKEHEDIGNPEQSAVDSYGGKLLFGSGDVRFSSMDLLHKELYETVHSTIQKPKDFPKRHGFEISDVKSILSSLKGLRVAVIGDVIVDEYLTCDPLGMSQEDPTIVVTPVASDRFIGGAAIVAAHARGLGADVKFFSAVGKDEIAQYTYQSLKNDGVEPFFVEDESRPTTLKQRYRASGKTLLRVSHLRQHDVSKEIMRKLSQGIKSTLSECDLLIFADFNYGCLPQAFVESLTSYAAEKKIKMVADSQSSSQVGDVSRYQDMLLMTPTEREARLATRDFHSGLAVLAQTLQQKSRAQHVVITLGSEGLLIHRNPKVDSEWHTDRLPAFNQAPRDPAGAGDSFLVAASLALTAGADIWKASYFGSLAAGVQVGRVGNLPLSPDEILRELSL